MALKVPGLGAVVSRFTRKKAEIPQERATSFSNLAAQVMEAIRAELDARDPNGWHWLQDLYVDPSGADGQDGSTTGLFVITVSSGWLYYWLLAGGWWLFLHDTRPWLFALVFGGGLLVAWLCYRAAVSAAHHYGDLIRVSFDCYRHDLLKKLHVPIPDNLQAEWATWHKLTQFHLYYLYPWDQAPSAADDPFYYDTHQEPAPNKPQQIVVDLQLSRRLPSQRHMRRRP